MFKELFDFPVILNGIQINRILPFHKQKRQARAKCSECVFIVSRLVGLKLSSHRGRKPTKTEQICLFYHTEYIWVSAHHVRVYTMYLLRKTNVSHPALPARLSVKAPGLLIQHSFTYVKQQTPEGRRCKKKICFEVSSTISLFKPTSSNLLNLT